MSSRLKQSLIRCSAKMVAKFAAIGRGLEARFRAEQLGRGLKTCGVGFECDPSVTIAYPDRTEVGAWVYMGPECQLHARGGLSIGNHSIFGPRVTIMTSMHNYRDAHLIPYDEVEWLRPVRIGIACWLGFGAIVLPGVELGDGCIVGAGAVVTKPFPAGSIIAGNPAKCIGSRDMETFRRQLLSGATYLSTKKTRRLEKIERSWNNTPAAD